MEEKLRKRRRYVRMELEQSSKEGVGASFCSWDGMKVEVIGKRESTHHHVLTWEQ